MSLSRADQESIHKYSSRHRDLLGESDLAGCFYCQQLFHPNEIKDWIDDRRYKKENRRKAMTALCPRCGIDAVLPSAAPIELTKGLLAEMNAHWFARAV